jgi:imidazolonepropionase-like amidohydrolase
MTCFPRILTRIGFFGALCVSAFQCLDAQAAPPPQVVALRAGRLVDVEHGVVLRDQVVLVRGDRIEAVQPASAGIPKGARIIDLSSYTVAPGLIECHGHPADALESSSPAYPLETSEAQVAYLGALHSRESLMAGFTTVRAIGNYRAFVDVALRDAINDGWIIGPRMQVAGAYLTVSRGGGEVTGMARDVTVPPGMRVGVANSPDEVRMRVREILQGGADFIKMIATGAVLTSGTNPGVAEFSEEEMQAAVNEAGKYGTYVAAHAHGADGIKMAVRAGVRSIEHGSLVDDEGIALMKQKGTWLVADIYNGDYIDSVGRREGWSAEILRKNTETTEAQREGFRKAVAAGVKIAYGTDTGVYPFSMGAWQLAYMVEYGMTPMQAIQSATITAAQLLRWDDRLGSITPGKYADLIAVQGDAMADLKSFRNVGFVMKGGAVVKWDGQAGGRAGGQ